MTAILDQPIHIAISLLKHASEEQRNNIYFDLWKSLYPYMNLGHLKFQSFNDFKDKIKKNIVNYSNKSDDEIIDEINLIVQSYEQKKVVKSDGNI